MKQPRILERRGKWVRLACGHVRRFNPWPPHPKAVRLTCALCSGESSADWVPWLTVPYASLTEALHARQQAHEAAEAAGPEKDRRWRRQVLVDLIRRPLEIVARKT